MSHRPPSPQRQQHREKSPQEKILSRVDRIQKKTYRDQYVKISYDEELDEQANGTSYHVTGELVDTQNLPTSESYDIIRYDDKPEPITEPEYFNEIYGQENTVSTPNYTSERYSGGKPPAVQRSRSVPPSGSSDAKTRLGASFPYNNAPLDNSYGNPNELENDNGGEYTRNDNSADRSPSNHQYYLEDDENIRGRSASKKVSYSRKSRNEMVPPTSKKQSSPLQCRFRADSVETDDSDLSFTVANPTVRKSSRPQSNSNRNSPQPPQRTNSNRSFTIDAQSLEDFANRNNSFRVSNRYSQDSIAGLGGVPSNVYGKDVLPLPIEIPDNVADAEAFRRYLSVRRGAITPVRQQNISFEKRNQSCPSYESIGRRRPRKAPTGLAPNGQVGREASRRTSSLSHAIMTLALLSASICQLRFLITYSHAHSYPILNYFLVFTSIILEVAAGIGYVLIARCSYDDVQSEAIHNYLIFALFIVAISNVILAAFAFDDHLCDELRRINSRTSINSAASQDQQFNQPVSRADRVMDLRYMPLE